MTQKEVHFGAKPGDGQPFLETNNICIPAWIRLVLDISQQIYTDEDSKQIRMDIMSSKSLYLHQFMKLTITLPRYIHKRHVYVQHGRNMISDRIPLICTLGKKYDFRQNIFNMTS